MKKVYLLSVLLAIFLFVSRDSLTQVVSYQDSWGNQGLTLEEETNSKVVINYSLENFYIDDINIDGNQMKTINVPEIFLPNDEGAPDLPGTGKYVAIPQYSQASVKIIASRTETISNIDIAPAPRIPLDTENGPLHYEKNMKIYSKNEFYPNEPVMISEESSIRGLDVVMLGITPFQYNPITKELIIYRDIKIEITFTGGNGYFGEDRLRSRWWDPIIQNAVLNHKSLPQINYDKPYSNKSKSPDYEYLIITLDNADFLSWADSIKLFRNLQGINTGVVTTTDVGGNTVTAIENYVDNAYNTWDVPPSAVLLLGDYGTGTSGITSQWYTHPAPYPDFVSDNKFADVNEDNLPDLAFARITANNASQLEVMITKFLDYERNPPSDADFYDHPITALGWQTTRWFQICSEVVGGYLSNVHGKNPVRINAVYNGNPTVDPWSTATNTSTVLNYFGPSGLGYIPATPQELGGFSGGTGSDVINAINSGSFLLQHRDHGSYTGWGEPAFNSTSINSLTNVNNKLPYIFSINCQTGAFHRASECFTEKFHRHTYSGQNSGALGVIAATEVSYSFVNDTYMWGVMDNLFPDFMPAEATAFPVNYVMPAFGNAAGKHFLYSSGWPYNTGDKLITYRLFHHHGGAFLTLYTEVPQYLTVAHDPVLIAGATTFQVTANTGSLIALTVNGVIIGTATGTGSPVVITIPAQSPGNVMVVTVTKQNYYRYSSNVNIIATGLYAEFTADNTSPCTGDAVNFTDLSAGSPTSWTWSFPGGTPNSYNGQNPPPIIYNTAGTYDVSLLISDGSDTDTETKTGYITVTDVVADFSGTPTTVIVGNTVIFTDNSGCNPSSWSWSFPNGLPNTANGPGPHTITYNTIGTYDVSLTVSNAYGSDTETKTGYIDVIDCNYCTASGGGDEYISGVQLGTINNTGTPSSGYYDYTSLSAGLYLSQTYSITVTNGTVYSTDDLGVWIDWNQDCDFDDTGENVVCEYSNSGQGTYDITVPATASLGSTRMRVRIKYYDNDCGSPCGATTYGEVEDYTIVIQTTSAPPVADFTADDTTPAVGQTVNFTDNSTNTPTSWSWSFNPATITYVGGTNSGSQNPQVQFNNGGYYTVTLTATNAYGSDGETKINYILAGTAGNWTGASSIDWNNASNWENFTVPTSADDVTVPATAANWPTRTGDLVLGTTCNNITMTGASQLTVTSDLTINSGKNLSCSADAILKVGGNWTNDGNFNPGTGIVDFIGTTGSMITITGTSTGGGKLDNSGGGAYYGSPTYNIFDCYTTFTLVSAKVYASGSGNRTFYWANSAGTVQQQIIINVPSGESRVTLNFNITTGTNHRLGVSSSSPNLFRNNSGVSYPYPIGSVGSVENSAAGTNYYYFCYDLEYSTGSGEETFYDLVISKTTNPITTNCDINVNNDLTVTPDAYFTNSSGNIFNVLGNAIFEAGASGMASYIDNGTTTITGTTNVEQYITSQRWHLVSPPVSGATISTYFDIYLKEYNEPTDTWTYLVEPTTMPMNVGQGYSAWASDDYTGTTTVTFSGTLINNNVTLSSLDYTPAAAMAGFNLVGNPFSCALDWNSSWSMSNMSGWMVIYDNGTYRGIHTDGTPYNGKTDGIIPSTQGFWVRALNASASITIPASERVHSGQAFYKETKEIIHPMVRLETEINGYSDETVIIFHPEATAGFDGYYDLAKFENVEEAPQLYTMAVDGNYAVNFYEPDYQEKIIPVGFQTAEEGLYFINASTISNFNGDIGIYLEDLKTGSVTKLSENILYEFDFNPLDDEHRFNLHFTSENLDIQKSEMATMDIFTFSNTVYIKNPALLDAEIIIYNMIGQEIISEETEGKNMIEIPVNNGTGFYLVKVQSGATVIIEKVLIK